MTVHSEQAKLRETFRQAILAVAAPLGLSACGADQGVKGLPLDAATDSTVAPNDAAADVSDDDRCVPGLPYPLDAGGGDADPCFYFVDYPCGPPIPALCGCFLSGFACLHVCTLEAGTVDCFYQEDAGCADGSFVAQAGQPVTIGCDMCGGISGRRPWGLGKATSIRGPRSALGDYFARASHLESASVHAFERLSAELKAHRAPVELVCTARRAALDERHHARAMGRLARRFGGEPPAVQVARGPVRSLERMARENAEEGCVRETFGALLATWQATYARDPEVRRCMVRIAADETRHAALAWAILRWTDTELGPSARRRVARATLNATSRLRAALRGQVASELVRDAGLPTVGQARNLLSALKRRISTHAPAVLIPAGAGGKR